MISNTSEDLKASAAQVTDQLLARVASIICEETCGLTSQCKSREAAKALFDKGYLASTKSIRTVAPAEVYQIIKDTVIDKENLSFWCRKIASDLSAAALSVEQAPQPVALTLAEDLRSWSNWMVSCACGNVSDEAQLLLNAADAIDGGYRSSALEDVIAERQRQVDVEGWTPQHDDGHSKGQMAEAASCYAHHATLSDHVRQHGLGWPTDWPWARAWWKPTDRRRDLVKAAALIIAEIERLDRAALASEPTE